MDLLKRLSLIGIIHQVIGGKQDMILFFIMEWRKFQSLLGIITCLTDQEVSDPQNIEYQNLGDNFLMVFLHSMKRKLK